MQNEVDADAVSVIVFIPREAGLLHFGVRSTYILGLQIGTQFCHGLSCHRPASAGAKADEDRKQD